jgi:Trk K+ transport system NAD-binding subunit
VWGANELREHLLYAELKSEMSFGNGEVELLEFEIPVQHVGRTVKDLSMDGQAIVTCVVRLGTAMIPTDYMVFDDGDLVYASVSTSFLGKYKEMAGY